MSLEEDLEPPSRSPNGTAAGAHHGRPRVVIFDGDGEPRIEILELPESATLGAHFCHCGTEWQVEGTRTGDRVLIVRPLEA